MLEGLVFGGEVINLAVEAAVVGLQGGKLALQPAHVCLLAGNLLANLPQLLVEQEEPDDEDEGQGGGGEAEGGLGEEGLYFLPEGERGNGRFWP